ncbi:acetaldehyde dehydrogenase (acetylating) [Anaerovorax sp. IOR16]|uniref:acetaldehyde dehydrogenase (acetylating) n=1 Tax=Anaerovorax sp. IOR16 TaxID=2773458 RepID=UPI0019D08DD8|nr:acetaldehyde dehydrogenase (acetylating) [Anaerovorax sp. IOR16]
MLLYDKDLLSVQEVRELVERAKVAQLELAQKKQEDVDLIVKSIAEAGVRNAKRLAQLAHDETGFGVVADKEIKNIFGSKGVYDRIKDMKTIGVLKEDKEARTYALAIPMGVIAGLIPSTNPTSTVFYKAEIAIKAGNAIVFSPHPNALNCILETVKVIRQAITEAGGNCDLVGCVSLPTIQATDVLMSHPDTSLILATGGSAMVRAAYSSGTPAIGVGPGNGPAYIERSANLEKAVRCIFDSKTFDNGTICATEQSVICDLDQKEAIQAEMKRQGAYFLNPEEKEKLGNFILRSNGTMNPMIVGKSAQDIATLSGISIPESTRVIVAEEDGVGRGHPYSNEKLTPILAFYAEKDYKAVCDRCCEILYYEGAGHTFIIHSENQEIIDYFAKRVPVSRFIINSPGAMGGIGASTGLMPSLTLGCGAVGGSATSENVGPEQLYNLRHIAYGTKNMEKIRKEASQPSENLSCVQLQANQVNEIVREIIRQLEAV